MDLTVIGFIVGALGTLFGGYQAYRIWRDKKPKLQLSLAIVGRLTPINRNVVVKLVVKNIGHRTVFIEFVGIEFPNNAIYRAKAHLNLFPLELRPEQSVPFEFSAMDLSNNLEKTGFAVEEEIKGVAVDTLERRYESDNVLFNSKEIRLQQKTLENLEL